MGEQEAVFSLSFLVKITKVSHYCCCPASVLRAVPVLMCEVSCFDCGGCEFFALMAVLGAKLKEGNHC